MNAATKCLVVLTMLASLASHAASADSEPRSEWTEHSKKLALKVHPLPVVTGALVGLALLPVELEWAPDPNLTLYAMVSPVIGPSVGGVTVNGGLRVFLMGHAPDGFFLGAQAGTAVISGFASFDLQPHLGYQFVFQNGITLGLSAGISLAAWAQGSNVPLAIGVPIGFAW